MLPQYRLYVMAFCIAIYCISQYNCRYVVIFYNGCWENTRHSLADLSGRCASQVFCSLKKTTIRLSLGVVVVGGEMRVWWNAYKSSVSCTPKRMPLLFMIFITHGHESCYDKSNYFTCGQWSLDLYIDLWPWNCG